MYSEKTTKQAILNLLKDFGVMDHSEAQQIALARQLFAQGMREDDAKDLEACFADMEKQQGISNVGGLATTILRDEESWRGKCETARRARARRERSSGSNKHWQGDHPDARRDDVEETVRAARRIRYHHLDVGVTLEQAAAYDGHDPKQAELLLGWILEHETYKPMKELPVFLRYKAWKAGRSKKARMLPAIDDVEDNSVPKLQPDMAKIVDVERTAADMRRRDVERERLQAAVAAVKMRGAPQDIGEIYGE